MPAWCRTYNIKEVLPNLNRMDLYSIRKPGIGKCQPLTKLIIQVSQVVRSKKGDLILCCGQ